MNAPLTVAEARALLRCSRARVFELLADGTLQRAVSYGRHTLVTYESVEAAWGAAPADVRPPPRPRRPAHRDAKKQAADVLARLRDGTL